MRLPWPISAVVFAMIAISVPSRAGTHVYATFSAGGAMILDAGFVYWGVSSRSRVGGDRPSDETPGPMSVSVKSAGPPPGRVGPFAPHFVPPVAETPARSVPASIDSALGSALVQPFFIFR